ncbi:hypothetical protein ACFY2R_06415 [Micromonospora olivasterospora]|uniref:Uncharacterized protein n=1 Tax=Micromonospora olivasterospora TaxID=1880 RepID=A0A562IEQ0_MICOL|nr:hypothetical protein [Micromonospora olivasterospora]TWH69064.1 hypothetical protein JD77_04066 [Micromonospora olivasterospora]
MQDADDVIATAEREWRAMGVVPRDRAALAADLRRELEAAAADGITPRQLLGGADVRAFARRLAAESGAERLTYETERLLRTALAGAAPGLVLSWLLLWEQVPFGVDMPGALLVARHAICAAAVLVGALLAVRLRMRDVPGIDRTVWAMALLVPLAGALVTPLTMAFAWTTGYSTALPVLLFEAAMVGAALAGATLLARWWALTPALRDAQPVAPGH